MEKKLTIEIATLCEGLPREFEEMLAYVRSLHFNSDPDYAFIEGRLRSIAAREGFDLETKDYDWIQVVRKKIAEKQRLNESTQNIAP
jgi:hypothetical protein